MILYFTGTGNSKFVAEFLEEAIMERCISLNEMIKNEQPAVFESERPFIIIAPIYAWRFPKIIEEFIRQAQFVGSKQIYFVATMASQTGNCDKYLKRLSDSIGMDFMGFYGVSMPDNYVISDMMASPENVNHKLETCIPTLSNLAKKINAGEIISKDDHTPVAWLLSGLVNSMFNHFAVTSKNYVVSNDCISCGKCEKVCPVNNIEIRDGKPNFLNQCINCYGCIHRCPKQAIDIKGKTESHGRYVCPDYHTWYKG